MYQKKKKRKKIIIIFAAIFISFFLLFYSLTSNRKVGAVEGVLKDGATEEAKQILDKSINTEINGYYVYISSQDNEKVLNIIKDKLK